ncbi:hypothetical protein [Variovorax sp. KK3]|uniref:hypothetical protein n=1 Tax=Variovorax sp. KK3 TaxID=1855728 RepID=UPI00117E96BD|nr:hypothetical protein [Variovorax sp. KK3]
MSADPQRAHAQRVVEESRRLISEIEKTLKEGERILAERGLHKADVERYIAMLPPAERERIHQHVDGELAKLAESHKVAMAHASYKSFDADAPKATRLFRRLV